MKDFVFFSSEYGHELFSHPWLSPVSAYFVSDEYNEQTRKYFKKHLGVREFNDEIVIDEIILSDKYAEDINISQQETDAASLDFVKYCFSHNQDEKNKERFGTGTLSSYALSSADKNGEKDYFIPEDDRIFFPSAMYDELSAKSWLGDGWIYCLSSFYIEKSSVTEDKFKEFIHKAFGVEDCTKDSFYCHVVRPHIKDIIENISGENDPDGAKNVDFISYLDDNYQLLFSRNNDSSLFSDIVLVSQAEYDIEPDERNIYKYNEELEEIINSDWFPDGLVSMCTHRYGSSKAILKIKAKEYTFSQFFDEVIRPGLKKINSCTDSIEKSTAFHNLVIHHQEDLTPHQIEVMKGAAIYLYGHDRPSGKSSDHRILSPVALELADKQFVDFSDLNVIAPAYKPEEHSDYWKKLGNIEFTVSDFIAWLAENETSFAEIISDRTRNITFWQWAKENVPDDMADSLGDLPVLLKDGSMAAASETVYLSDAYTPDGGIENIVKQYKEDARFVSSDYPGDGADRETIERWAGFWPRVGILSDILDILISTVIPNLETINNDELPSTLARYRTRLEERLGGLPERLTKLRVKGHDGNFRPIADAIYIDCEKSEPFPFISLPEQISISGGEERRLIKEVLGCAGGTLIGSLTQWQSAKINRYHEIQDYETEKEYLNSVHYQFVSELAGIYKKDKTDLDEFTQLGWLKLFGKDGALHLSSDLTMGSAFNPPCDFEKYFPDGRKYLSDAYIEQCGNDVSSMLQRVLHVHCDFEKDDIQSLAERDFAVYFWTEYLKKPGRVAHVRWWMEHGMFNTVSCIPTKNTMKKPSELYSVLIEPYVKNVVNGWENKLPLETLPDIGYKDKESGEQKHLFDLLDFKQKLDFTDALTALFAKIPIRKTVVSWMVDQYEDKDEDNYSRLINEYRANENAKWLNNKNKLVHISKLYALDKDSKMLWDYFKDLPRIINTKYLPSGNMFKKACDMLKIRIITNADLEVVPVGVKAASPTEMKILQLYALVIAGLDGSREEDSDSEETNQENSGLEKSRKWKDFYNDYKNKISAMKLWQCQKISVQYKEDQDICQKLKKFHHDTDSAEFYYVESLYDRNVFQYFVDSFIEYLGTGTDQIIVSTVMNSREDAIEYAKKDNDLMCDEEFKAELGKLGDLTEDEKAELKGNKADDDGAIRIC